MAKAKQLSTSTKTDTVQLSTSRRKDTRENFKSCDIRQKLNLVNFSAKWQQIECKLKLKQSACRCRMTYRV